MEKGDCRCTPEMCDCVGTRSYAIHLKTLYDQTLERAIILWTRLKELISNVWSRNPFAAVYLSLLSATILLPFLGLAMFGTATTIVCGVLFLLLNGAWIGSAAMMAGGLVTFLAFLITIAYLGIGISVMLVQRLRVYTQQ